MSKGNPPAGRGGGLGNAIANKRKPKNVKATIGRIFSYLGPYKFRLVVVFVCIILSALANVLGANFIAKLIDNYITPLVEYVKAGGENPDFTALLGGLFVMGATYMFGAMSTYAYNRLMVTISTGVLENIRNDLFEHMQKLPIKYYDTHTHGELMSRYTNDIDTMRELLSQVIPQTVASVISIVGVFVSMIINSPALTILVVIMFFVMIITVKVMGTKSGAYFKEQQIALGKMNGNIEEYVGGQKVVKVFNHEKQAVELFDGLNRDLQAAATKAHKYSNTLMPVMGNLSYIHYALTAMVGCVMLSAGGTGFFSITVGRLGSFLQLTRQFSMPITNLSQLFVNIMTALAGAERVFNLMDEPVEPDEGKVTLVNAEENNGTLVETPERTHVWAWKKPDGTLVRLRGDVRFENVTFGYEPEKIVLKNLSLYAKPGQKIAFVGSTGAGKTTITNLINRFYDVNEGRIIYDGIDVRDIKKADLRRSLAMVLQDTHLFTGTVMENIRYGNENATDEEVIRAAKIAYADTFIELLPDGYNTVLTADGSNLSQGQRQLLAIARAAVADPPVLILDEATSSIDTRTELHIEKAMDRLMENRTVFVIAHRLSTVKNSNAIMVLEHGEVIERGDHAELIRQHGRYYQLYMGMFELT